MQPCKQEAFFYSRVTGKQKQLCTGEQSELFRFLELLLEDEQATRQAAAYKRKLSASRLSEQKTLETYDFSYQPELDKRVLMDLSACRFMSEHKNVILMGNPGVGKTHLANGLGIAALRKGYKVHFTHANTLIEKLYASKADGSYRSMLNKILSADLLIIDKLGFKKLPASELDDFLRLSGHAMRRLL
jgi:DNA replication protein DnaC